MAAQIERAADNVQLVRVMEASGEALQSLHVQVGGAERVGDVVDRLREQMAAADEVGRILAEEAGTVVLDEGEIDDELAEMVGEEKRKAEEADRARREAEERKEAEEMRRRLEAAGEVPDGVKLPDGGRQEKEVQAAEDMMSRMSLKET